MRSYSIREARDSDSSAIATVLEAAFRGQSEAKLVRALSEAGDIVLSLVAESHGAIIGNVVYSKLLIDREESGACALAPIGVLPDWQCMGVGSALIQEAHLRLKEAEARIVFVLGDAAYYRRFGFLPEAARKFHTPYDGPHLMAYALREDAKNGGDVTYAKPFSDLV